MLIALAIYLQVRQNHPKAYISTQFTQKPGSRSKQKPRQQTPIKIAKKPSKKKTVAPAKSAPARQAKPPERSASPNPYRPKLMRLVHGDAGLADRLLAATRNKFPERSEQ